MLLETANERAVDSSILIISLVQSATTYLRNSLSEVLDIPVYRRLTGGTWNTEEILYPIALEDIRSNPVVAYTHAHPNSQNFIMLNAALDRAILNIRDPRQVLVSIVHFIDAHVIPKPVILLHIGFQPLMSNNRLNGNWLIISRILIRNS